MSTVFPRPPTVPRRDPAPEAKPLSETLKLGPNSKDATSKSGTSFALVGAEAALIAVLEKTDRAGNSSVTGAGQGARRDLTLWCPGGVWRFGRFGTFG